MKLAQKGIIELDLNDVVKSNYITATSGSLNSKSSPQPLGACSKTMPVNFKVNSSNSSRIISHGPLSDEEALYIKHRQLLYYRDEFGDRGEHVTVDPSLVFKNDRLRNAYIALQALKQAILSDPFNITGNWVGSNVCKYTAVFCTKALDNRTIRTVAGIDLNHGDIAGYLPEELGLLTDLVLLHINSNRFCGTVPHKFNRLKLLFELDLSNNRFARKFPRVVLRLPKLKFLDLRFNEFEGTVPKELFDKDLDATFINHNRFRFNLPDNFGNSPVSVIVLANNKFHGCVPASLGNMSNLNEIILMNNGFRSCLPSEIGMLKNLTVFDVSFNQFLGLLPETIGRMVSLEQLNVAHNFLSLELFSMYCPFHLALALCLLFFYQRFLLQESEQKQFLCHWACTGFQT
ncbi:leucine-rich repeat extensin-like protein 4 [Pyrus communis]|uniref:leucine-rich repeat extensin-like protein 4 n=1 Tax=Pyrus communis TaxID=23211 RepID=UPI0035BFF8A8